MGGRVENSRNTDVADYTVTTRICSDRATITVGSAAFWLFVVEQQKTISLARSAGGGGTGQLVNSRHTDTTDFAVTTRICLR